MATIMKQLCLLILMSIMCKDVCGDEQYQLTIHQEPTSTSKEWSVTLENLTPCVLLNVKLDCKGFQSRTTIDPKIILKQDDLCIVNGGERINPGQSLHFLYISEQQFPFKLADQSVAYVCGDEQYQLTIHQEPTSTSKEWSVTLENLTPCVLLNVKLDCKGFQSRTTIDPKIILKQDDLCIVNGGERINPGQSLHFLYISEQQFPFKLADQSVAYVCGDEQYQLTIHQEPTSTSKEWSVTLENLTPCVLLNVKLDCKGFQSRTTIDPKIILKQDDLCIVNGGERINPGQSLHFLYISEQQFPFKLADQSVAYVCGDEQYQLTIHQEPTSTSKEWSVTLENLTPCVILNVKLDCKGFQSRTTIDPKIILKQDDLCIVNGGERINPGQSLHFLYISEQQFPFKLADQSVACS
ncbi:hypothetical protein OSB04_014469 [Centaurea solstitialis]|uniref:CUB domain-containing protein n=1 Tax=Centaurea solstitialis TaxID=347529 RepID=A0AA38SX55_9ASTR|nr:hypothetical protein OSB04_014469 [Centaurea solstitialis]